MTVLIRTLPRSIDSKWVRQYILPIGLALLALAFINLGLHGRLAPRQPFAPYQLPYINDFAAASIGNWFRFGGNWSESDGMLQQGQADAATASIFLPLWLSTNDVYQTQTRLMLEPGTAAALAFNGQYPRLTQNRHQVQFSVQDGLWQMICGYFQGPGDFRSQAVIPLTQPGDQPLDVQVAVNVSAAGYAVRVNEQTLIKDVPLFFKGGLVGLATSGGSARFDDLQVFKPGEGTNQAAAATPTALAAPPPEATPAPAADLVNETSLYSSAFTGALAESGWIPFAGDWAIDNGSLVQRQVEGYDLGIAYQEPFEAYQLTTRFRHLSGVGGGVLFNMTSPDSKNGAVMVRYTDDGSGIFWGSFDEQGAFTGQGYAATENPGTNAHTLDILHNGSSYSIKLDGNELATGMPLVPRAGYIGLTASQSQVAYEEVSIKTAGTGEPGPAVSNETDLLANAQSLTGEWQYQDNSVQQVLTESTDYMLGIGILAERYALKVDVMLPADLTDAGGGIIFHMPNRDDRRGAYMARLAEGGKVVFWGRYNDNGDFEGIGAAEVNLVPGTPVPLTLIVGSSTFDLLVGEANVATGIPLERDSGWIGLVSYRGVVTFRSLALSLNGTAS